MKTTPSTSSFTKRSLCRATRYPAVGEQERTFFKGEGWLFGPLLGVDGVGGGTKLYQQPRPRSRVIGNLPGGSDGAIVRGCQGKWMYVEYKKLRGWAAPGTLCSNSLTTCV